MYSFPNLIKEIREEAGLKQSEFADALGVSTVLVTMVETGQKEVSKKFLIKLAELMDVQPTSITPFLFHEDESNRKNLSAIERQLVKWGETMQHHLIKQKAPRLSKYAKK